MIEGPVAWQRDTLGFYAVTVIAFMLFTGWAVGIWLTDPGDVPARQEQADTGRVMYSLAPAAPTGYQCGHWRP